jgi:hypothetical protein
MSLLSSISHLYFNVSFEAFYLSCFGGERSPKVSLKVIDAQTVQREAFRDQSLEGLSAIAGKFRSTVGMLPPVPRNTSFNHFLLNT